MQRTSVLVLAIATLFPLAVQAQTHHAIATVRLRTEPSPTAAVVVTIPRGAAVEVKRCTYAGGTWCAVEYAARTGYAAERYLSAAHGGTVRLTSDSRSAAPRRARSSTVRRSVRRTHVSSVARGSTGSRSSGSRRSSSSARGYHVGPRGGCYTYSASGRKRYVDRSLCS